MNFNYLPSGNRASCLITRKCAAKYCYNRARPLTSSLFPLTHLSRLCTSSHDLFCRNPKSLRTENNALLKLNNAFITPTRDVPNIHSPSHVNIILFVKTKGNCESLVKHFTDFNRLERPKIDNVFF